MKIFDRKLEKPNHVVIAIPRQGDDIIFFAEAIMNWDDFGKLCPSPLPPTRIERGKGKVQNTEDPFYKSQLDDWATKKVAYTVIKSLAATPGIEWEKVKLEDSNTWLGWEKELEESGFSDNERARILNGVMEANALSEAKVEEARKRFLASQEGDKNGESSNHSEQPTTPSGVPAKGSA